MTGTTYRNRKNGTYYTVLHMATDATNSRSGAAVIVYRPAFNDAAAVYVRDAQEFFEKFDKEDAPEEGSVF